MQLRWPLWRGVNAPHRLLLGLGQSTASHATDLQSQLALLVRTALQTSHTCCNGLLLQTAFM
jgi:hypothetical protein